MTDPARVLAELDRRARVARAIRYTIALVTTWIWPTAWALRVVEKGPRRSATRAL